MNPHGPRVAFFPDAYREVDGVANTSRQLAAFAKLRGLPLLLVHAGPRNEIVKEGSLTRIQLRRGPLRFPLDRGHAFDLLFLRHYRKLAPLVCDFAPEIVQITGPSDVGILGTLLARRLGVPLAASWQTNLHQYARSRVAAATSFLPQVIFGGLPGAAERWSFRAMARFYKIPRILFAPNPEIVSLLTETTGKPCFLMSHSVDTQAFDPAFRDRRPGSFRIGYVGRLTAEKDVRLLVQIEQALVARGRHDFQIVVVGQGREGKWLRQHLRHAEFAGVLTGEELSRAFANLDTLVFPSETETFGLVVLEAFASGVPAVVAARGGPKFTVQHDQTGFIARNAEEFADWVGILMTQPERLVRMRAAARARALSTSWEQIFEGMYEAYRTCLQPAKSVRGEIFDVVTT